MDSLVRNIKNSNKIKEKCLLVDKVKKYIPNIAELLIPAAENIKINELESISGKKIPESFRNLYLQYNGEGEKIFGVMAGFRWMDIDSIIREMSSLQESAYEIISDKEGLIKEGEYKKGWIPFAEDCGGSFLVMDLEPDTQGTYGQIVTIDRESDISYVISESFEGFLQFIEDSFKNDALNIVQEEEIKVIQWKRGHLFDDIIALTNSKVEDDMIPIDEFWTEYFEDEKVHGYISKEILAKQKRLFITADMGKKLKVISLDILKNMINLKELIIHADEINSFEPIKDIPSLTKLVIGSKSFKDSDLQYIINLERLKELTLVKLTLNDISILENMKALKCLSLYRIDEFNSDSIGCLKNLVELSLDDMEVGSLSYISALKKLTKLELQKVNILNLDFLKGLKKLTVFETDKMAKDESSIIVFQEMPKIKELIYPIGDMEIINNCANLRSIGINAASVKNLEYLSNLNITSVTIFNATSGENAKSIVAEVEKFCKLTSYGWEEIWRE